MRSTANWTALSVVIAAAAVFCSNFWSVQQFSSLQRQSHEERRHKEISVSPRLAIVRDLGIGLYLENHGFGPARVYQLSLLRGTEPIGTANSRESLRRTLARVDVDIQDISSSALATSYWIAPGKKIKIIEIGDRIEESDTAENVASAIASLGISFCYCTLYERCWTVEMRGGNDGEVVPSRAITKTIPRCERRKYITAGT